ncbi:NAD-P-binding protein [Amylostereum chailletii]|nr:NAD-P-binding protein [Amylostereum chailletii]
MTTFDLPSLFNVKDKVVLITGGSRGIGKMIATGFVRNGARVYISSRSTKDCATTVDELNKLGPGICAAIPADIQKVSEVERLVAELSKREKALHVLVNNAGAAWGAGIDSYPDEGFSKVINLNLQRVFTLTQKCLPLLRAGADQAGQTDGKFYNDLARIINIGSVEGLRVPEHETYAYSASKAALHHLSRTLAGRLGWEGITSNTIACGPFQSKMMAQTLADMGDLILKDIPAQRIGSPEDVAGTALWLSSRAGAYVSGATIALDGGHLVSMPFSKL